jgi:cysteinyl-tRNA synthetase
MKVIIHTSFMTDTMRFYNTKTRSLETFKEIEPGIVRVYSCGPTVYHYQHIGNMRAAVFADTLHRTLLFGGYEVRHIINITDVGHLTGENEGNADIGEDKMEKGARREGKSVWDIAKMYTDAYFKDLSSLNVHADEYLFPRATDHIAEQIALVKQLEEKGYTYTISDGVYFDTAKFKEYGDFAHLDIEGLQSGARVEENKEKRNVTDFALWKFSPTDEKRQMEWESPWGTGFPGWHIECSAMAMKYLGERFDIHTGGIEHIPVHHTNEIAQSECATGHPYVNVWMHNNHLLDTTGKMSKSSGDFLTLSSLAEKGYEPLAYRYFLLGAQYRKELQFSFEALDAGSVAYEKLQDFCRKNATKGGELIEKYRDEFREALYDDLNTAKALSVTWNMVKDYDESPEDRYRTLVAFDSVLGLDLESIEKEEISVTPEMQALLDAREKARESKDFAESDRLREEIGKLGYTVKDTPEGQELTR